MRRFEVKNVSISPRVVATLVPIPGAGKTLVPGVATRAGDNSYRRQRGPSSAVVGEEQLRALRGYYLRGQISVRPLDGRPLPDFLLPVEAKVEAPAPTEPNTQSLKGGQETAPEPSGLDLEAVLSGTIKGALEALEGQSDEVLVLALEMERAGKNRSTLIATLEDVLSANADADAPVTSDGDETTGQEGDDGSEGA